MITRRLALQASVAAGAFAHAAPSLAQSADPWKEAEAILARIKAPTFPNRTVDITAHGAKGDGVTDCTDAIRAAITACNAAGGGVVRVPKGTWLTGAVHLKSNVNLRIEKDATLLFTTDLKKFLPVVLTRYEGIELMHYSPLIYAYGQENIAVTGEGTIDGQGSKAWWPLGGPRWGGKEGDPVSRTARTKLGQQGEAGVPVAQRVYGDGSWLRTQFIQPYRCKNVLIEGVSLRDSPMWQVHPVECENVTVRGLNIAAHGPNTDGCDPDACKDVLIEDCYFDTGDDCIAIKSGRNAEGRRLKKPCENIIIRNCFMKNGHGGVTLGSEITGGVRNVFVENCKLDSPELDHALRFKNNAMRGGVLENIHVRNIAVGQVAHAVITIDFNYEEGAKGDYKPVLRNLTVENLVSGKSLHAVDLQGLPNASLENITLRNCVFNNAAQPSIVKYVDGIRLENVMVNGKLVTSLV
jgi:polygalacturonase